MELPVANSVSVYISGGLFLVQLGFSPESACTSFRHIIRRSYHIHAVGYDCVCYRLVDCEYLAGDFKNVAAYGSVLVRADFEFIWRLG